MKRMVLFQELKVLNADGRCGLSGHRVTGYVVGETRGESEHVWEHIPEGYARIASDMPEKQENAILTHAKVFFVHTFTK